MDNKKLWNSVCKTDPKHVKSITGKSYQGSSPKPYWLIERATETFGPCGIGWGINVLSERFERFGETESQHIASVEVWYLNGDKIGKVHQMGQTRSSYVTSSGKFMVDEDAAKKSVTDGMVKCLSMIGFAGDIFGGRWDDSKYVSEVNAEFRAEEKKAAPAPPQTAEQTINSQQFNALQYAIEDKSVDKVAFCEHYKIESLSKLPASLYDKAMAAISKKVKP